jgi:hypothetical protein
MERMEGLTYLVRRCAETYGTPDIAAMRLNVTDTGNEDGREYSMCYSTHHPHLKKYCGPDWTFHHWPSASIPSFQETVATIMVEAMKPPTIPKIGWFGNIHSPSYHSVEHKTRPLLKQIGDAHPDVFDIVHISPVYGKLSASIPQYRSLPELVRYQYLIDIGGNGYSGRLKYLLFSKRPLLLVDRTYVEYFHEDLVPYTHYIPVSMDLSNLLEQAEWVRANPAQAQTIAEQAFEFAMRHFTMEKVLARIHSVYTHLNKET